MSDEPPEVKVIYLPQGERVRKTHIGDGAYASFDGSQIWLETQRGFATHEIALDGGTFEALLKYAVDLGFWRP